MKKLLLLLSLLSFPVLAYKPVALPGVVYLEGIGAIYGVAAGLREIKDESINIMAFKSYGKAEAYGFMIDDVPIYTKNLTFRAAYASADNFEYENTYARGLSSGTIIKQEMAGKLNNFGLSYQAFSERLKLSFDLINTHAEFLNFRTLDGDVIPFAKSELHDINSEIKSYGISYKVLKGGQLTAGYSLASVGGRAAQSDLLIHKVSLKGEFLLSNKLSLGYYTHAQTTEISNRAYGNSINGRCSSVTSNATDLARCQQLEGELSNFIDQSNKEGTAAPIGGSRHMRAYREWRFKSAVNATQAIELRRHFFYKIPWQVISSFELAQASDTRSELLDHSRYSASLGVRAFVKEMPIRLEGAVGNEGETVFLTVGAPW